MIARLAIVLTSFALLATAASVPALADELKAGKYECATRGGRVLPERNFSIGEGGSLARGTAKGSYSITGDKVDIDMGGGGKQLRILSDGRLKMSDTVFCSYAKVQDKPPAAAEDAKAAAEAEKAPDETLLPPEPPPPAPGPKLIKVQP